ncbi:response regulator [Rhodoferax sp. WC2427]|uniref:response regulator n=1 Tax=Rhodoferax sp. WC2427 TaxID=3234144 RepID=UPI003466EB65
MQRILLLDDEHHVLSAIKRVLRAGFGDSLRVEETTDPERALLRLKEVAFDVVVSDYRMPLMTGTEFLSLVRSIQPYAVRMILSASSDFETVMRAVNDVEVFRYLAKPWSDREFVDHVRQALERSAQTQHERDLADIGRQQFGAMSASEVELRRLEALEPGLTHVEWGPDGEVLGPKTPD